MFRDETVTEATGIKDDFRCVDARVVLSARGSNSRLPRHVRALRRGSDYDPRSAGADIGVSLPARAR